MQIMPQEFSLPFVGKKQLSPDTYLFQFDRRNTPQFQFLPGQWIRLFLDLPAPDPRGNNRSFSISSNPENQQFIEITTKISQSPFKHMMMNLQPGLPVKFFGPAGIFIFNDQETQPHVFLAGGIGITPFRSMMLSAATKQLSTPLTLVVSFSTAEEVIFQDELSEVAQQHPNLRTICTVSHPEISRQTWTGESGRISDLLLRKYVPEDLTTLYYLCGPEPFVQSMEQLLRSLYIGPERIKKEHFTGY